MRRGGRPRQLVGRHSGSRSKSRSVHDSDERESVSIILINSQALPERQTASRVRIETATWPARRRIDVNFCPTASTARHSIKRTIMAAVAREMCVAPESNPAITVLTAFRTQGDRARSRNPLRKSTFLVISELSEAGPELNAPIDWITGRNQGARLEKRSDGAVRGSVRCPVRQDRLHAYVPSE